MSEKSYLPQHLADSKYAKQNGLLNDRVGRFMVQMFALGTAGAYEYGELHSRVHADRIKQALGPPFRVPGPTKGRFVLGQDLRGRAIRCPVKYLNEHTLTVATTGSGKTTKSRFYILQLAQLVRGLFLFDFRKREFGILRPYLARIGVELIPLTARQLRINLLQVPRGTDPRSFAAILADGLVGVLKLPPQASKLLLFVLIELYSRFGVLDGGKNYPTLAELRDAVAGCGHGHPESRRAIVTNLDAILASTAGLFRWRVGWEVEDLAKYKIAFDLSGVTVTVQNLLLNALWLPLMFSRVERGVSNPSLNLIIVCDEAARLCGSGDGSIADLIGAIRGTGIGLDLSVQSADVTRAILSNTPNKFIGRCSCANDYDAIGAAMGLTSEQRAWLPTNLEPGMFVAQLGRGPLRRPFLCRIPNLRFNAHEVASHDASDAVISLPSGLESLES